MPWIASSPSIRLTCWTRSLISRSRSRWRRRSSSSATLGTRTTPPSVLARRARRSTCKTCRIDDVVAYAVCFEQTVEPEPVVARLVARNDFHGLLHFSGNSRPNPLAQIQEPLPITGLQRIATDLVRQGCVDCNNPTFLAQFDCQKAPYGVIMGCGGRQVVYCPGFHQCLQCAGGEVDTDQIATTFRPRACIGSVSA